MKTPLLQNGVNKPRGIPCEHPTVTGKPFVPKREITGGMDLGDASRERHLSDDSMTFGFPEEFGSKQHPALISFA